MSARVQFADVVKAAAAFERTLPSAMLQALTKGADSVVKHARRTTLFTDRTKRLRASIRRGQVAMRGDTALVDFEAGGQTVSYAAAVHNGSRPHFILPKVGTHLRFNVGGRFVFVRSVFHPGTSPRPFMRDAVDANVASIGDDLGKAVELAFARAFRNVGATR